MHLVLLMYLSVLVLGTTDDRYTFITRAILFATLSLEISFAREMFSLWMDLTNIALRYL